MKYAFFVWKVSWYLCEQDLLEGEDRCGWISPRGQEELSPNKMTQLGSGFRVKLLLPFSVERTKTKLARRDQSLRTKLSHACMHTKSLQSRLILCDPMDCSPPGSSVLGLLQARILEWAAMPSSRGSSYLIPL